MSNTISSLQRQVAEGIDAVIVDSVLAIRKGLTESQNKGLTPIPSPHPGPVASPNPETLKETMTIPALDQKDNTSTIKLEAIV